MTKDTPETDKTLIMSTNEFPVVGIGASAGGLAAFKKLIAGIAEDSGMAYVLVQHLDPKHESLLPELLQKNTKLPVLEITDDIKVEPNHIYIIPSNKMLLATNGILKLSPRPQPSTYKQNLPIDLFFNSLAIIHQSHSLGVVLTGLGSDGTEGLRAIKEYGGITFAQDVASAEWKDMPRNAIEAGVVDFELEVQEIPNKIREVISTIDKNNIDKKDSSPSDEDVYRQIIALLRVRTGTDFTYYKKTTIYRRIMRRMVITKNQSLVTYLDYLKKNKEEQDLLFQDLLIPVTTFFRDPDVFDNLCKSILPSIIQNKKNDLPIRLWVAGCSTGQEAYSMAICLKEYFNAHPDLYNSEDVTYKENIKIFASDISEIAISKARKGFYTKKEVEDVGPKRLKEFFSKSSGGYLLNKEVRELCVFAVHNFLKDPPFSNMDLISCRNVLIYFQPYLQKKALTNFHYALNTKGYLLLGSSETTSSVPDHFTPVLKGDKFFMRRDTARKTMLSSNRYSEQTLRNKIEKNSPIPKRRIDFQQTADEYLLQHYTPASVVVNESMDIVLFRGDIEVYLGQQDGIPSHNLAKMAKGGLAFELHNIFHKVKKDNKPVIMKQIPFQLNGNIELISLEAVSLPNVEEPHYLILFHPPAMLKGSSPKSIKGYNKDEKDLRIEHLEKEIMATRENMRSIIEDQEAANEVLQTANEELLSTGEEMQSLNEELETSREELQSTNEEISAVNHELINLNEQLTEERNFAEGIIMTVREPLLVLDKNLKVIRANDSFYKTFQVNESDTEGRLIYELGNGQWNIPELKSLLESLLPERDSISDFEVTQEFESLGARTMLLNAREIKRDDASQNMILLVIEDITYQRYLHQKDQEILSEFVSLVMQAPIAIMVLKGKDYKVELANDLYLELVDKEKDFIGSHFFELMSELKDQGIKELLDTVLKTGKPFHGREMELSIIKKNKKIKGFYNFVYQPMFDRKNTITGIMVIVTEVTDQVLAQNKIDASAQKYNELIHSSPSPIAILGGEELIVKVANKAVLDQMAKGKEIVGKPFLIAIPSFEEQGYGDILREVYKTGKTYKGNEMPINLARKGKNKMAYYNFIFHPQRHVDGQIIGVTMIATEVTAEAELNKEIRKSEARYHQMADLVPDMITNATVDGEVFYYNKMWADFSGWDLDKMEKQGWEKLIHPEELQSVQQNWNNAVKSGDTFEMEMRILDKNGHYKWHISRAIPVKDENGKILMWIGANTQIQKLKEEEKRKEDFMRMVSHELKTPITSIKGYTQLLLSLMDGQDEIQWDSLPIKSSLERIDNQTTRLTRLISEMLDIDRIEVSQLHLQKEKFNLNVLIENTIQDIVYAHAQAEIIFSQEVHCDVFADRDRIGQVIINLITNAIKYSPDNKNIEVKIFEPKEAKVSISIKDYGVGIPKKDQKHVFERFYRVSGTNEEKYSGFGIGLYLCKEIIERHQGVISVKSEKGKGSEFTITLDQYQNHK
ncbi:chemotaxis protein CheB [Gelidibacter sp.]|uniref:chemotaxis protein CheB n=1 Tax=Gelidibacter sp. TaxID=2018083 RepID=UPI002C29735D|nr:chemotaxis protein CheB [Gelidibacter sp.]HUH27521.1 chemotaxis protein CheB [Gelidibacter sp.]